jgi:hypothetical protein
MVFFVILHGIPSLLSGRMLLSKTRKKGTRKQADLIVETGDS